MTNAQLTAALRTIDRASKAAEQKFSNDPAGARGYLAAMTDIKEYFVRQNVRYVRN